MAVRFPCGAERRLLAVLLAAVAGGWGTGAGAADAAAPALAVTVLPVQAASGGPAAVPELVCTPRPGPPPPAAPPAPTEVPDADEVAAALAEAPAPAGAGHGPRLPLPPAGQPLRIGVWGDSHMAAGFFTEELARLLGAREPAVRWVPAGVGHGGVRGLVRKACVPAPWGRESAHVREGAARAPGPGLVSLVAGEGEAAAAAVLALDLRDAAGRARHRRVQLLYGATAEAAPARLALRVDGGEETELELPATAGAAALELQAEAPLSTLQLRVLRGPLRLQGLRLSPEEAPAAPVQLDVFGYPGATAAGWARADLGVLRSWFGERPYDVAVFAYGTNEANDRRFTPAAYGEQLARSLAAWREAFPEAACLLLAPGDRGVRVPARPRGKGKARSRKPRRASAAELLKYARLHEQVARLQEEAAARHGCVALSLQALMGGRGSAYAWARSSPARMAADLLHFTPAGYRELAQRTAASLGWPSR